MKKIILLVGLIIFAVLLSGCTQLPGADKTYENQYFKINYPADWGYDDSLGAEKGMLSRVSFAETQDNAGLPVALLVDVNQTSLSLTEVYYNLQYLREQDNLVQSAEKITFLGEPAIQSISSMPYADKQLKVMAIIVIKNNRTYYLGFVAPVDKYDSYLPIGEKMINSFEIK